MTGNSQAMRIAVPDLVSSSYLPMLAAVRLPPPVGLPERPAIDHVFPARATLEALRDCSVQFAAVPAHTVPSVFPKWRGAKLLVALSQRTYWLLVAHVDADISPGAVHELHNLRIAAAPGPDHALRQLLIDAGVDSDRQRITIEPLPRQRQPGESFGVRAARALSDGAIDAFWANSMGAELAVAQGVGRVVLDPRRGDGPPIAATYTFPALVATDGVIGSRLEDVRTIVRSIVAAQHALKEAPERAREAVAGLFPPREADFVERLTRRDAPYYSAAVDQRAVDGLNHFTRAIGRADTAADYDSVVAAGVRDLWSG